MPVTRAALDQVLRRAREASAHSTDQGNRFERLCRAALLAHDGPNGTQRFADVWLWSEWPGRRPSDGVDIGIDLVAQQTAAFGGGLCAIQCKFWQTEVTTTAVDSFLAASSRAEFTHRVLMHTGTGVQHHGRTKIRHAHPPCEVFDRREMGRWHVDWWELAERHHVVAPGTPRGAMGASMGRFNPFRWLARYWRGVGERWRHAAEPGRNADAHGPQSGEPPEAAPRANRFKLAAQRAYLAVEATVVTAAYLAVLALIIIVFIVGALALITLATGGKDRKRRR